MGGFLSGTEKGAVVKGTVTEVEAKIANVDRKTRQISLSVRAMEEAEEKEALRNLNEASADEGEVGPTTIGELIKAQMEGRE